MDQPDLPYACKEICRKMSSPRSRDWNVAQQIHSTESTQCDLENPSYSLSAVKMFFRSDNKMQSARTLEALQSASGGSAAGRSTETGFKAPPQQP